MEYSCFCLAVVSSLYVMVRCFVCRIETKDQVIKCHPCSGLIVGWIHLDGG